MKRSLMPLGGRRAKKRYDVHSCLQNFINVDSVEFILLAMIKECVLYHRTKCIQPLNWRAV